MVIEVFSIYNFSIKYLINSVNIKWEAQLLIQTTHAIKYITLKQIWIIHCSAYNVCGLNVFPILTISWRASELENKQFHSKKRIHFNTF